MSENYRVPNDSLANINRSLQRISERLDKLEVSLGNIKAATEVLSAVSDTLVNKSKLVSAPRSIEASDFVPLSVETLAFIGLHSDVSRADHVHPGVNLDDPQSIIARKSFITDVLVPLILGSIVAGGNLTLKSTEHATKGNILFGTSTYDEVNNRLGLGTLTPQQPLDISGIATALQLTRYSSDTIGPNISQRKAGGTATVPTAVQAGYTLLNEHGDGYDGSAFATAVRIRGITNEIWTAVAHGTYFEISTTLNGTTTVTERVRVTDAGNVGIGDSAPTYTLSIKRSGGIAGQTLLVQDATATTGVTTVKIQAGAGQGFNPIYEIRDAANVYLALFNWDGGYYAYTVGVAVVAVAPGTGIQLASNRRVTWQDGTNLFAGAVDTALSRNAAGVVESNDGTPGNTTDFLMRVLRLKGMTTTQRNALIAVAGMVIYNTTTSKFNVYITSWIELATPYVEGTFTITATGFTAAVTGTAKYIINGSVVTLFIPTLSGTSNATTFTLTGLPAAITPVNSEVAIASIVDNTIAARGAYVLIAASTTITMSTAPGAGGAWTNAGTKGVVAATLRYMLV